MLSRFSNLKLSSTLNLAIVDDSVQFSHSVMSNPMDCRTSGFSVRHQLLDLTQTHVHWVGDVFQSFQPLSSPSVPTFNHSQHQGLFQWVSSSHSGGKTFGVSASASILPMNIQDWFPLGLPGLMIEMIKKKSHHLFNIPFYPDQLQP